MQVLARAAGRQIQLTKQGCPPGPRGPDIPETDSLQMQPQSLELLESVLEGVWAERQGGKSQWYGTKLEVDYLRRYLELANMLFLHLPY